MKLNNFCIFAISTMIIYSIVLFFYYNKSQEDAINQAQHRTKDLLRSIKASKIFFNKDLKNTIKKLQNNSNTHKNNFLPELTSCTYASNQINNYYNNIRLKDNLQSIDIAFVAKNPKNIDNIGVKSEIELLKKFNSGTIKTYSKVIENKKGKYLYFAKPTDRLKESCLECHGSPKDAPKTLIKKYGEVQGFNHDKGEIRAFIRILMPLDEYLRSAQNLFWSIAISSLMIIVFIFVLVRIFINKIKRQTEQFQTVIDTLDEIIILKSNKKIHSVSKSFLKFFGAKDLKSFEKRKSCTSDIFVKNDKFLDIDFKASANELIKKINSTEKAKRIIQVPNKDGKLHILSIKVDKLKDNEDLHVIVLSDITKLQERADKFKQRANIDSLTQAFTRQKFNDLYGFEFSRSVRYLNPLTILFVDIDYFKNVNDKHGHDIGDYVLKEFTKLIATNIREFDIFARWGGEEFILMLPQTNINDGYKLAEKIRKIISSNTFKHIQSITCSIGISTLGKEDTTDSLIKRADNALYKAKNGGRNRTIIEI